MDSKDTAPSLSKFSRYFVNVKHMKTRYQQMNNAITVTPKNSEQTMTSNNGFNICASMGN